jgi:CheY-like chemotaxis protein
MRIEHAPIGLIGVMKEALEAVRPLADKRRIGLELVPCDDDAWLTVSGDRTRLIQVFTNLLNNAVKFSADGRQVRVTCEHSAKEARVYVDDEGQGIAPEFLPYVFERFRQADGSTTRAHGGLGIGLALVKSLVEAHGGTADVASAGEGRGSRFTIRLPLLPAPSSVAGGATRPARLEAAGRRADLHALVVEDARDTLDMLQVVLEARGYQTTLCETAGEALRAAASTLFDIIVSDIGLPETSGYELIRHLRQMSHLRDVPAIALTGYAAQKDIEAALAAGFDTHVAKPVDPSALVGVIEQLLQQRHRAEKI